MRVPRQSAREPPAPPTRAGPDGGGRGISIVTVLAASAGSALSALITSIFWPDGSVISAALTPLIIALVSEAVRRPTERLTSRRESAAAPGPLADGPIVAAPGGAGPYRVYGARRRRVRLGLALITAAVAFAIAAVTVTLPELLFGGAVATDRRATYIPVRPSSPPAEERAPSQREEAERPPSAETEPRRERPGAETTTTTTTPNQPTMPTTTPPPTTTPAPQPGAGATPVQPPPPPGESRPH